MLEVMFLHEIAGTAVLTLLGCGVVANVLLNKTNGKGSAGIVIFFGWGLAVYIAYDTRSHINPAGDLGPRLTLVLLPIRHKGTNNWPYV